ncbi:hypothetical protein [Kitasatospora sp. RG8]|uniref:hypothetical protein n=1 Tax=Kitasatospora sp. RG8 TaxID=2820815 RepID=UPI001FD8673D|nr:hypothetical protein [Kitasatospora sp. RG8]
MSGVVRTAGVADMARMQVVSRMHVVSDMAGVTFVTGRVAVVLVVLVARVLPVFVLCGVCHVVLRLLWRFVPRSVDDECIPPWGMPQPSFRRPLPPAVDPCSDGTHDR